MTAIADKMRARAEVFRSCAGDLDVEIARLTQSRDMLLAYARDFDAAADSQPPAFSAEELTTEMRAALGISDAEVRINGAHRLPNLIRSKAKARGIELSSLGIELGGAT